MPTTLVETNESATHNLIDLSSYAESAYLAYAMSVVMGRALPMLCDGQKPVQRRILYAMHRMGLTDKTKPVKCARFVGDIIGKYHPHGDSSVYEASVRMAQNFSLRYPLVDGQGNFGSRDGDSAAAMRYTEARLTPIAELLLGELDQGTVDFAPNYDGTLNEPLLLPARLPMLLLNGASGIAVGMATEIVSHNLAEVADACTLLIESPDATLAEVMQILPGPDFACGAQIISSQDDLAKTYATGRGSIRTRARWTVEQLAKGQWQIAVTELPPDASTAKVMAEIETLTNPQIKAGKKALTQEQLNLKALVLSLIDRISDDSDGENPVRLIIEPRSSRLSPDDVMQVLLAHTSLEANVSMNLVTIGQDGKPQQKTLLQVLHEWIAFRYECVTNRTRHRLEQVKARMHTLEGRLIVFAHLDDVIRIIRTAEEPKAQLIATYALSEAQATDILEIRLRQLANLEYIKLESELAELRAEQGKLQRLLDSYGAMTTQILGEIKADKLKYADARRTLIQPAEKVTTGDVVAASDDPVTLIVSRQGWLRARTGHKLDLSALSWKPGDDKLAIFETRSTATVALFDAEGRVYNVSASSFPTGRGDGIPVSSLLDMGGKKVVQAFALDPNAHYLVSNTAGYGFVCPGAELSTRVKAGKAFMTLTADQLMLAPVAVSSVDKGDIVLSTSAGKLLMYALGDVKVMGKGKGVQLVGLGPKDTLVAAYASSAPLTGMRLQWNSSKGGAEKTLTGSELNKYRGARASKGTGLPDKAVAHTIAHA